MSQTTTQAEENLKKPLYKQCFLLNVIEINYHHQGPHKPKR